MQMLDCSQIIVSGDENHRDLRHPESGHADEVWIWSVDDGDEAQSAVSEVKPKAGRDESEILPVFQGPSDDESERKNFRKIERVPFSVPSIKIHKTKRERPLLRFMKSAGGHETDD